MARLRIASSLILLDRLRNGTFRGHLPENTHLDIRRSYREDGLPRPVLCRVRQPASAAEQDGRRQPAPGRWAGGG